VTVLFIGVGVFPLIASPALISLSIFTLIAIVGALGLNILTGMCGQFSLGHAAFMAVGAYTSAILSSKLNVPFLAAFIASGSIAALLGLIVGIPSIRLKGFYLAISTLAFQFIVEFVILVWPGFTGGMNGFPAKPPSIFGFEITMGTRYYYLCATVAVMATLFVLNISRSKYRRIFIAIRDRDIAAEVLGINIFKYKLLSFAISSFYAGIAGSLFAHYVLLITPEQFTIWQSIEFIARISVGGMWTIKGAVMGAILISSLPDLIRLLSTPMIHYFPGIMEKLMFLREGVFGVAIILFLIYEPEGLAKLWFRAKNFFKLWPYSY